MPELALVLPAYNEGDGIGSFLLELDGALRGWDGGVRFVVVDDASTDATPQVLKEVALELSGVLEHHRMPRTGGHGSAVTVGYRLALQGGADYIFQVDGDGQFDGRDVWKLVDAVRSGADVACGVRRGRKDPWFRLVLARLLQAYLLFAYLVRAGDPNCPFRLYRREVLEGLLAELPKAPLVPNVYLTILAKRQGYRVVEIPVRHRARRGARAQGSTWGRPRSPFLVPPRLISLVLRALVESLRFARRTPRPSRKHPPRDEPPRRGRDPSAA